MIAAFPEFTKLTLAHREEYEFITNNFPPIGDTSFNILTLWWGTLGEAYVSRLGDNVVVSYWLPGDDEQSGLSLLGTDKVDEAICVIFDHLRERGELSRLVNVPEFVVNSMRYPELFSFKPISAHDEYIVSMAKFADLDRAPLYMRARIRKFIREHGKDNLQVKNVNLKVAANRRLLLEASEAWPIKGVNNMTRFGREFLSTAVQRSAELELECIGLFVSGQLQAYLIFTNTNDAQHVILLCARVNYELPWLFDYMIHAFAAHLHDKGVSHANLYSDADSSVMRIIKIGLRPDSFYRKYAISPARRRR